MANPFHHLVWTLDLSSMPLLELFCLSDFEQHDCQEREVVVADARHSVFAVRYEGKIFAYVNSCPHTGVSLNWQPHEFLDYDRQYIQCAMHGALFRIEDGYCIRGPCAGASLKAVKLHPKDDGFCINSDEF